MKTIKYLLLSLLALGLAACYDDEGNYNYSEVPVIEVEANVPSGYLRGVDNFVFTPTITSTQEGEITADNPNFEYACRLDTRLGSYFDDGQTSHDMNPEGTQSFTYEFVENAGSYEVVYSVKDKRTDVTTYFTYPITLSSSTYEGWMVLCNEGDDNRVRLDMITVVSGEDTIPTHNILTTAFPENHNATMILYNKVQQFVDARIFMCSETGSYELSWETLTTTAADNLANLLFLSDLGDDVPVRMASVGCGWPQGTGAFAATTKNGDAYIYSADYDGAMFESIANATEELGERAYHVSPYIGNGMNRTGVMWEVTSSAALFFDTDNRRFMKWDSGQTDNILYSVPEDHADFIPFGNVGQDLVYMEGTKYDIVYAVLDNGGSRSVLAINLAGDQYVQQNYYENITAENFNVAEHFTFHSLYPYMFYSYGDKVYTYNYATKSLQSITLPGEEITMVKTDLFKTLYIQNIPEEVVNDQYYVLVGSYDPSTGDNNGGTFHRYRLNTSTGNLELVDEWDGFGKIVDVVYRERW